MTLKMDLKLIRQLIEGVGLDPKNVVRITITSRGAQIEVIERSESGKILAHESGRGPRTHMETFPIRWPEFE